MVLNPRTKKNLLIVSRKTEEAMIWTNSCQSNNTRITA